MLCRIPSDNRIRDIPLIEGGNAGRQVDGSQCAMSYGLITIIQRSLTSTSVDLSIIVSPIPSRVRALISLSLGLGMCPAPTLYTHIAPFHLYISTMLCRIPSNNRIRDIPLIDGGNAGRWKSKRNVLWFDNNLSITQHSIISTSVDLSK